MSRIFWIFKLLFLFCLTIALQAQDEPLQEDDTNIQNEVIEVVKLYEPILADAQKVKLVPDLEEQEVAATNGKTPVFNDYQVPNRFLSLTFDPPTLRPLAHKAERSEPLHNFWLKAGFGNYTTPLLDLSASTRRPDKHVLGFNLQHLSSRVPEDYQQDFMNNAGKVFGKFYLNQQYLNVEAAVKHNRYFYYGYDWADTLNYPNNEDVQIDAFTVPISIEMGNKTTNNSSFYHKTGIDYHYHQTNWQVQENQVALRSDIQKRFDSGWGLGFEGEGNFTTYDDSIRFGLTSIQTFTLNAVPHLSYAQPWGKVQLGVNLLVDQNEFIPYPDVELSIHVIEKYLTLYGAWQKRAIKNNSRNTFEKNPFIGQSQFYQNSVKESRFLGFRGNIKSNWIFDVSGGQYLTEKQPLFVNLTEDPSQFLVVYDDNMQAIGGQASLAWQKNDHNSITATVQYFDYTTESENEAWHLPNLQFSLGGNWQPIPKLNIQPNIVVYNGAKARRFDGTAIDLDPILDLNLSVDYWLANNFSLFLDANNLLNRKTERFLNYPSYGINVVGGIKLKF